ncbi:MAG: hypothetical protein IJ829_07860 [Kiritimatiellae bacterium]|nr:hypothetical protein [Kiritimatiellia bacterium]
MKKLIAVVAVVLAASFVHADVAWDWWCGNGLKNPTVHLGIACKALTVKAAEVALLFNKTPVIRSGAQVSLAYNDATSVKWVQAALVNRASSAKVQLGLLNFNKNGFLPFFPLFNLDKSLFD